MNSVFNQIGDILLWPFEVVHPLLGLIIVSCLLGVVMILVFKWTSDQDGIQVAKDRMKAHMFAIRIFKEDLGVLGRSLWQICKNLALYQFHFLKPVAVAIIPLMILLFQLDMRFSYDGLDVGQRVVLKAELKEGIDPAAEIEIPEGLVVEATVRHRDRYPADVAVDKGEVVWRLRAEKEGDYEVKMRVDGKEEIKRITVGERVRHMAPIRTNSFWEALLYPAEAPLAEESPFESIQITYPSQELGPLSGGSGWVLAIVFVLSMVFGYAVKGLFGVEL
ncbi:MAG: hypothetical protein RL885_14140 [Planctomycetota bacterium]